MSETVVCRITAVCMNTLSAQECDDAGVCKLPGASGDAEKSGVLSPVGASAIPKIKQAPRLTTLNGKTIAVVGGSFMASVTHPEIKRLILQHYPDAKVYVLREIGSAGPWPGPGVIRRQKDEFVQNLKRLKVDAVISGNGGCGLCTPKEMGSCIAAEHEGLPSVMIAAPALRTRRSSRQEPRGSRFPGWLSIPAHFPPTAGMNW